jgi:hypothetical protein
MDCFCLGYKVEIPKKEDKKAWLNLRQNCRDRFFATVEIESKNKVKRKHEIEKEIIHLESLGENKERARQIAKLNEELNRFR